MAGSLAVSAGWVLVARILFTVGAGFAAKADQLFEGLVFRVAAGIFTSMIFHLRLIGVASGPAASRVGDARRPGAAHPSS